MTDYTELVEALRLCQFGECGCGKCYYKELKGDWCTEDNHPEFFDCDDKLKLDSAAAIEALQAEIRESMQKCAECGDEQEQKVKELKARLGEAENSVERWKDMYLTKHEPKRGEWIHGKELSRAYIGNCCVGIVYEDFRCSACGVVVEECEKPKWKYCPNCGAKMTEVQDA